MQKSGLLLLACASILSPSSAQAASFADRIQAYVPGTGFATDFTSGAGFTNATAALGEPSRNTAGQFGGPVDPFNPPYLKDQLVSIGAGGSLTVGFATPILNRADNPFGLDFTIFGNTGFVITNGDFSGGGVTDGSLFGANPGTTRVWVSSDNITYYQLDPARAPVVDGGFFPTAGAGSFDLAVNPTLAASDFGGRGLEGIRSLYNGSAGGAGFDLSWAQDAAGKSVVLREVRFVRVDVLSGAAEIDGFAVPSAVDQQEDFASDPAARGWRTFGDADLFHWSAPEQALEVTWDSSKPNSYFYRSLGTVLSKDDDARISFDLRLEEIAIGITPGRPFTFELAVGLINLASASTTNFHRGTGSASPNLLEFDYFPDSGFGATVSPAVVSSNNQFVAEFAFPLELRTGDLYHVELSYTPTNQTLTTTMQRNGEPYGSIKPVKLAPTFTDFRLDTLAISSYSDAGADGSLRARGSIDNLTWAVPLPPSSPLAGTLTSGHWQGSFIGRPGWTYTLERTEDWQQWRAASAPIQGTGAPQTVADDILPRGQKAFYRFRLERP